jgi:dihydrodipicolinate reductase
MNVLGETMPTIEVMGDRIDPSKGPGRLATKFIEFDHGIEDLEIKAVTLPSHADVLVYSRKTPDTLPQAIKYSSETETPLIFASSGLAIPEGPYSFALLRAANLDLRVNGYMQRVKDIFESQYAGWTPTITEHHQETKVTADGEPEKSGTAKKLAEMLGVDEDAIVPVRDFERSSTQYDIPETSRDGYAVHLVVFTNPATGETSDPIEIVVRGRETYAQGLVDIYRAIQEHPEVFTPGLHDIVDLVKRGVVRVHDLSK